MTLHIILYSEPVQNTLWTSFRKDIILNKESWHLCKSSWKMFCQRLGWPESKPAVKKFCTIWTTKKGQAAFITWRNFGFFCSVNHLSRPPRKQIFTWTSSKGCMVCDWWISIHFCLLTVFHWVRCSVWGNHQLNCFEDFFWSFLLLSLGRIK